MIIEYRGKSYNISLKYYECAEIIDCEIEFKNESKNNFLNRYLIDLILATATNLRLTISFITSAISMTRRIANGVKCHIDKREGLNGRQVKVFRTIETMAASCELRVCVLMPCN